MSNYLQRVIAAGGRRSSLATPPPAAPTVMPAAVVPAIARPLDVQPMDVQPRDAQPMETERAPDSTTSRMSGSVPVTETQAPEIHERAQRTSDERATTPPSIEPLAKPLQTFATPASPPSPPQFPQRPVPLPVAIARMSSGTRVRAPKGLRPSVPMPQVQTPKISSIEGTNLVAAVSGQKIPVPAPGPIAQHPKVEGEAFKADVATHAAPVGKAIPQASTQPPTPIMPRVHQTPMAPRIRPAQPQRAGTRPSVPLEEKPASAAAGAARESAVISIKPRSAVPAAAAPLIVQERSNTRQNRITIGKVDVQVNNQRPLQAAAPARQAANNRRSNFLETRYLSRFPMRP